MKYGIIYLWYDRKHKRYYVGSHWGTEDDGYVCSSTWMNRAYRRRPGDFKRKIISRVFSNRKDMLEEEYRFLYMIKQEELGKKYYNKCKHKFNHWSAENIEYTKKTISEKTKMAMQRPEIREKLKKPKGAHSKERLERHAETMKKNWEIRSPFDLRYKPTKFGSEEYINKLKEASEHRWRGRSVHQKQEIAEKISNSLVDSKQYRSQLMSSLIWWNNGVINKRATDLPGPEWIKGRLKNKNKMKPRSDEAREKLRLRQLGKKQSQETINKRAAKLRGQKYNAQKQFSLPSADR